MLIDELWNRDANIFIGPCLFFFKKLELQLLAGDDNCLHAKESFEIQFLFSADQAAINGISVGQISWWP